MDSPTVKNGSPYPLSPGAPASQGLLRSRAMAEPLPLPPPVAGTAGYGANAAPLAEQYERLRFEDVHAQVLHLYPAPPGRVLDVGAGSGRDAAALARRGHEVLAVEPTPELRAEAMRRHADAGIVWLDDHLPALAAVQGLGQRFDLVLLTAVWMHLEPAGRAAALPVLAGLLAPGGVLSLTLRHGPVPAGRRMFDVPPSELVAHGTPLGLRCLHVGRRESLQGHAGVHWSQVVLQRM